MKQKPLQIIKFLVLFNAGLIFSLSLRGQNLDKVAKVTPMAPDAASIFKVLERPLGNYTGTVPVSFPLLSISSGSLSNSLSLDYNSTGGIRVEEVAGSTGLGFSLSGAGGVITQQIQDQPDDLANGMLTSPYHPSTFYCGNMTHIWQSTLPYEWDLEPDIFYYNFNGRSGKFFFTENGDIAISENAGIKIEHFFGSPAGNGIKRWIITDENGNKYYFGQNKTQTVNYWVDNTYTYQSLYTSSTSPGLSSRSWYLTEVKDMNEENTLTYSYALSEGELRTFSGGYRKSWTFGTMSSFNTSPEQAIVWTETSEYLVSRIDGRNGYVLVNSGTGRVDGWGRKVNTIELYDANNALKKKFKFNYGYFNAGSGDVNMRRLKLNNFSECAVSGTDSLTYNFDYEEFQSLPSRYSNSVDFWGFYNGKYNSSYFPNLYYKYWIYEIRDTESADRSPVFGYAEANILKKITYPTGGHREFVYEGNTAMMYTVDEHLIDPNYMSNQSFSRDDFDWYDDPTPCMKETFSINSSDGGAIFRYTLDGIGFSCSGYHIKIFQTSTPGDLYGGFSFDDLYNQSTWKWELANGHYRIEVYKPSGCTLGSLDGAWSECTLSTATITTPYGYFNRNNINVGGVRVKELRDYDPVSATTNTTEFKYKLYSTDSTFTSGVLITPVHMVTYENPGSWDGQHLAVQTSSAYPLAKQGGSYVVYPEVRTIESGNGRTDRLYSFEPDPQDYGYPSAPAEDYSFLRGNLLEEKVYHQNGSLLKKSNYEYGYGSGGSQVGFRAKPYYYDNQDNGGEDREWPRNSNEIPWHADCRDFYVNVNSALLVSQTDSVFASGEVFVTNITHNYYARNNQLIPRQTRTTASNGAIKSTIFKYPFTSNGDFAFGLSSPEQTMKSTLLTKNYLRPIEVVDSLHPAVGAGSIIGGTKNIMSNFSSSIHLGQVKEYTSASHFRELYISGYDAAGNPTERYRPSGSKEVYIWGYNYGYPVAKVIGSDYATVLGLVNNSVLQSPSSTIGDVVTELTALRNGLAGTGAQVYTYGYYPLVGMQVSMDGSGKRLIYEYDQFMRLKNIMNDQGYIKKNYQYHYKP